MRHLLVAALTLCAVLVSLAAVSWPARDTVEEFQGFVRWDEGTHRRPAGWVLSEYPVGSWGGTFLELPDVDFADYEDWHVRIEGIKAMSAVAGVDPTRDDHYSLITGIRIGTSEVAAFVRPIIDDLEQRAIDCRGSGTDVRPDLDCGGEPAVIVPIYTNNFFDSARRLAHICGARQQY